MKKYKLIILSACLLILIAAGTLLIGTIVSHQYRSAINQEKILLIEAVHEAYPEVSDQALLDVLKTGGKTADSGFLKKYGYDDTFLYSQAVGRYERTLTLSLLAFFLLTGLILLTAFLVHERRRRKKTEDLIRYTNDIARGVYDLKMDENSEEDLSRLANALFKVTVRLREAAENSRLESEALSRSLQDISHQLKTPLTSIRIMLDNIDDDPDMDPEIRQDFLRSISGQIDLISQLTISLLQLARFDSGAIVLHPTETKVGPMIEEVFENLSILAEIQGVELVCCGDLDASWILDRKWEMEAWSNIIKNSLEHSPEGSTVTVRVEHSSVFLKIMISDQGEGIAPEDQRHIFERFYKAKNSSEASIGIGLSFARTILEREGGSITVDSVEGKGTTFTIRYIK